MSKKHGEYSNGKASSEIVSYRNMHARCYNHKNEDYPNYGGRGIVVCDRWKESFSNFLEDMGRKPSKEHSLDRIDVNGNYCKENCRWATILEQGRNKRRVRKIKFDGKEKTIAEWGQDLNLERGTLYSRIKKGKLSLEEALFCNVREINYEIVKFGFSVYKVVKRVRNGSCKSRKKDFLELGEKIYEGSSIKNAATLLGVENFEVTRRLTGERSGVYKTFYIEKGVDPNKMINYSFSNIK